MDRACSSASHRAAEPGLCLHIRSVEAPAGRSPGLSTHVASVTFLVSIVFITVPFHRSAEAASTVFAASSESAKTYFTDFYFSVYSTIYHGNSIADMRTPEKLFPHMSVFAYGRLACRRPANPSRYHRPARYRGFRLSPPLDTPNGERGVSFILFPRSYSLYIFAMLWRSFGIGDSDEIPWGLLGEHVYAGI